MQTIRVMNINSINLNLFVALDALLTECHVSRAAEKLFITQGAMSNNLNQLRQLFEDELLVRGKQGMVLTRNAKKIQPKIRQIVIQATALVQGEQGFIPALSTRVFELGLSDYGEYCIMPRLMGVLRDKAPHVKINTSIVSHVTDPVLFERGEVELVIGCLFSDNPHLCCSSLPSSKPIVVASATHPTMQGELTIDKYLAAKHIRIRYQVPQSTTRVDNALNKLGYKRDVALTLPQILPALFILPQTDLVATTPAYLPDCLVKDLGLLVKPTPFIVDNITPFMVWHRQDDQDDGLAWLRDQILQATQPSE